MHSSYNGVPEPSVLVSMQDAQVVRGGCLVLSIPGFALPCGQVLGIMGPNGAGKTTLLHVLGAILPLTHGYITYGPQWPVPGIPVCIRRAIGMVLQDSLLLDGTVLANVALGPRLHGMKKRQAENNARESLELLGITHLAGRRPHTLSGGEAQRVSLARALAYRPLLLLLDEPFSSIDIVAKAKIITDLKQILQTLRLTAVLVSHDFAEIKALAHRLVVLLDGQIISDATPEQTQAAPQSPVVAALVGQYC